MFHKGGDKEDEICINIAESFDIVIDVYGGNIKRISVLLTEEVLSGVDERCGGRS